MLLRSGKLIQFLTVLLVLSVSTMFASGSLMGVLQSGSAVQINGNFGDTGMTVLPGSEIKSGDLPAEISLPNLGSVQLDAKTTAFLDFGPGTINLRMVSGTAQLMADNGVQGTILTESGQLFSTTADASVISSNGEATLPSRKKLSDGAWVGLGIGTAFAVGLIIYFATKCKRPSASPTGPCV